MNTAIKLMTKILTDEKYNTKPTVIVGGVHKRIAPNVPPRILKGRGALGRLILNNMNAMNSMIIPKQYKKFSAATISSKLNHDNKITPDAEKSIPIIGVPNRDLMPKHLGNIPLSAIPKS